MDKKQISRIFTSVIIDCVLIFFSFKLDSKINIILQVFSIFLNQKAGIYEDKRKNHAIKAIGKFIGISEILSIICSVYEYKFVGIFIRSLKICLAIIEFCLSWR